MNGRGADIWVASGLRTWDRRRPIPRGALSLPSSLRSAVASRQDIPANWADIRAGVRSVGLDALFTDGVIFVGWQPRAIYG